MAQFLLVVTDDVTTKVGDIRVSGSLFLLHSLHRCRVLSELHKATHRPTPTAVALKRILMHNEKEGMLTTPLREIRIT
ncbi:hypothetical protein JB92DRAFT_2890129 [Gautieria morchelliformis]|nr:hypothetical protein JB92DRAFT_2890129 [Gautieria morchelliformis]